MSRARPVGAVRFLALSIAAAACTRPQPPAGASAVDPAPATDSLAPADALERAQRAFARLPATDDAPRILELTRIACDGDVADGCVAEAVLLRNGIGAKQDLARAIEILTRGCDRGHAASCTELGLHYDLPWGVPWDEARARELYRAGSEGGDTEALVLLAQLEIGAFHEREGIELADAACRAGNPRGCILAYDADTLARDTPIGAERVCDAPAALERDCRAGSIRTAARSCLALWTSSGALHGELAPTCAPLVEWRAAQPQLDGEQRAQRWVRAACDLRSVEGCGKLGIELDDTSEGIALLRAACDLDDHDACEWLAYVYFHDWVGAEHDRAQSIELYARVCERGDRQEACRMWASYCGDDTFPCPAPEPGENAVAEGPRSELCGNASACTDAARAARLGGRPRDGATLYEEACRLGAAEACYRLGDMHTTGELGKRMIDDAIVHYARACDLDHAMACVAAGAYALDAARDEAKACAWLERACDLGEEGGCEIARDHCASRG
jgi:TPR repeat protein